MITEDDLRTLLADHEVPVGVSPSEVRARARSVHVRRRVTVVAMASVVAMGMAAGVGWAGLPGFTRGGTSLPQAFGGDGRALPVSETGVVALNIPHLYGLGRLRVDLLR